MPKRLAVSAKKSAIFADQFNAIERFSFGKWGRRLPD
jgi:hypothetical protein